MHQTLTFAEVSALEPPRIDTPHSAAHVTTSGGVEHSTSVGASEDTNGANDSPNHAIEDATGMDLHRAPPGEETHLQEHEAEEKAQESLNGATNGHSPEPMPENEEYQIQEVLNHGGNDSPDPQLDIVQAEDRTPRVADAEVVVAEEAATAQPEVEEVTDSSNAGSASLTNGFHGGSSEGSHDDLSTTTAGSVLLQPAELPPISAHILQLAATKEWADWTVQVNSPISAVQPFFTYAHGLMLSRSKRMRSLMARQQETSYNNYLISLFPKRPIVPHAFEAALRFVYSDTVLSSPGLLPPKADTAAKAHALDYVISYWISGIELGLEPVASRALDLLQQLMDWDILELAVRESATFHFAVSGLSKDQTLANDYFMAGKAILHTVASFMAARMNITTFKLDTVTSPTVIPHRLPLLDDRPKTNPVLSSMVFGSMPSSTSSPSSPHSELAPPSSSSSPFDTAASIILLNIPYNDLCLFHSRLNKVHGPKGNRIIAQLVEERESRREKLACDRRYPNKQRMTNSALWDIVGWREFVEDDELRRERVGFLIPVKSLSGSVK